MVQRAASRGLQGQHTLAEQGSGADVRGGFRAERRPARDGESDQRVAVFEFDRRHCADLGTRHGHVVAFDETSRLGEEGLVLDAGGVLQQPFRLETAMITRIITVTPMMPAWMSWDPRYLSISAISFPRTSPSLV